MTEGKSILIPSPHGWAPAVSLAADPPSTPIGGQIGYPDPYRLFAGVKGVLQWNPSQLVGRKGLHLYDEMRRDEQIKAAIAFKKRAIVAAGWSIQSPENKPDDWEPRKFVEWCFDGLDGSMSDRIMMMLTAIEYGFSVGELVWGESSPDGSESGPLTSGPYRGKWPLEDIVSLKPHTIQFDQDDKGDVLAVLQKYIAAPEVILPPEKVVLMTYQCEWGNPYGRSDFEACYDDWWLKTSARKWLAMLLERFGIPPIFAMYNSNKYSGAALDRLKDIITNLQAGTAALIPRMAKEDLEMWTPALASQVADVFIPALDRCDRGMARGILMPNLIGATPEQHSGSFARAMVNFDVFMFAVDSLRTQVEECINDQIIWRMMAINYASELDEYPRFEFKPLTQDSRIELMDGWSKMLAGGAVVPREEDETHIREIFGFPDADSPPLQGPQVAPDGTGGAGNGGGGGGAKGIGEGVGIGAGVRAGVSKNQAFAQQAINFTAIEKRLNELEEGFTKSAKAALGVVLENLQTRVRNGLPYDALSIVDLWARGGMMDYATPLEGMLLTAFDEGRRALTHEVLGPRPPGVVSIFDQAISRVKPAEAIAFLKRKAITLTATLEDEILKEVRRVLIAGVETGMSTGEVADALAMVFEKWIGSDVLRDGEDIKPYRLEAIARTETTGAYSHGRLVAARDPELQGLLRGMRFDAILDSRTSDVCQHLYGKIIKMEDPALDALQPPLHVNCRSILTPVTISRQVDESEFITPSEVGRAKELAGSGFAGGGSF